MDQRKLNAVTKRDSHPTPRMDECINLLGKATVFSTLDNNSGHCQIKIEDADKDNTAFIPHHGLCRINRMPIGLENAKGTFHHTMDMTLSSVKSKSFLSSITPQPRVSSKSVVSSPKQSIA